MKHFGRYAKGGGIFSGKPFRHCLECGRWLRNPGTRSVLHNGRKP